MSTTQGSPVAGSPIPPNAHRNSVGNAPVPFTSVALVLGSCASLQIGASLATQLFPHAGSWGTTFIRLGFAALILLLIIRPKVHTWSAQQWRAVALYGFATGLMNGFFYASIARIPLGIAVTVEFIGPLLLSAILTRRLRDMLWVGLASAGLAILGIDSFLSDAQAAHSLDPWGIFYALVAGAFWAAYILTSKKTGSLVPGQQGLAVALVFGTLILAPMGAADSMVLFESWHLVAMAVGTGVLASLIPYSFELAALRTLPPAIFSILLSLEPVFAAFFGWILLNQGMNLAQAIAIVIVVSASIGTTVSANRRARRSTHSLRNAEPAVAELCPERATTHAPGDAAQGRAPLGEESPASQPRSVHAQ